MLVVHMATMTLIDSAKHSYRRPCQHLYGRLQVQERVPRMNNALDIRASSQATGLSIPLSVIGREPSFDGRPIDAVDSSTVPIPSTYKNGTTGGDCFSSGSERSGW